MAEQGPLDNRPREGQFSPEVDELEYLLRVVSFIIKRRGREILSDFDITHAQFNALLVVLYGEEPTMGDVCRTLGLASSTVTDLVDRMEEQQLVARRRDEDDRRVIRLTVEEKGEQLIDEVMTTRKQYLRSVLTRVPETARANLLESLQLIHEVMTEKEVGAED